jgi:hypothetical protein
MNMDIIRKALADVKYVVPKQILETVFLKKTIGTWRGDKPASLDDQIRSLVIFARVHVDCNLVGGAESIIPLEGLRGEEIDVNTTVYTIPKDRTQNRSIVSVLNITFIDPRAVMMQGGNTTNCGVSAMQSSGQALMDSMAPTPVVSSAQVQLIGENVVLLRDVTRVPTNSYLRCILGHDEMMSHIQPRSFRAFCKLVEYAVKSYIYNNHVVEMDTAEVRGGHSIGRFKEIIDGYADAEELYQTFLREKWEKIERMNDREGHARFIRSLIGGPR